MKKDDNFFPELILCQIVQSELIERENNLV